MPTDYLKNQPREDHALARLTSELSIAELIIIGHYLICRIPATQRAIKDRRQHYVDNWSGISCLVSLCSDLSENGNR